MNECSGAEPKPTSNLQLTLCSPRPFIIWTHHALTEETVVSQVYAIMPCFNGGYLCPEEPTSWDRKVRFLCHGVLPLSETLLGLCTWVLAEQLLKPPHRSYGWMFSEKLEQNIFLFENQGWSVTHFMWHYFGYQLRDDSSVEDTFPILGGINPHFIISCQSYGSHGLGVRWGPKFTTVSHLGLAAFSLELCIHNSILGIIKNINMLITNH